MVWSLFYLAHIAGHFLSPTLSPVTWLEQAETHTQSITKFIVAVVMMSFLLQ
jgi:hypothetical protein